MFARSYRDEGCRDTTESEMRRTALSKRWLRKRDLRLRYGDITDRTIERMVKDGRLPPPEFPLRNKFPMWDEARLDEHDRTMVRAAKVA